MISSVELKQYICMDVQKYKGSLCTKKASLLERFLVKKRPTESLHPNPNNDFTRPEVGPHFGIINEYCARFTAQEADHDEIEPLVVEKIDEEQYLILDGHHRWAAAMMLGIEMLPVRIVNLTHEEDHIRMMNKSKNTKRVIFDFDKVLCTSEAYSEAEPKPVMYLYSFDKIFKERLRYGVPALIRDLQRQKYDVWVYTSTYESIEYLQLFFKAYKLNVDGIINGAGRLRTERKEQEYREMLGKKYSLVYHVENDGIFRALSAKNDYENFELSTLDHNWAVKVLEVLNRASAETRLF